MRRMPIQLDEETYRALKKSAYEQRRSIASIVRESLSKTVRSNRLPAIDDFTFVGSGKAARDRRDRVSENHDSAVAEAFAGRRKRT